MLKALLLPPACLVCLAGLGVVLRVLGRRRLGRALVALSLATAVALSLPHVAYALTRGLQRHPPLAPDLGRLDVGAIVVLGGDLRADPPEYGGDEPGPLSLERCRYGAALAKRTGAPLLVSGGVLRPDRPPLAAHLARFIEGELGVAVRWREERSHTTRENARFTAELLRAEGVTQVAIVTHAWHMPRAVRAFERAGLAVVPAPTAALAPPEDVWRGWVPRSEAFLMSTYALHEWLGQLWYAVRG